VPISFSDIFGWRTLDHSAALKAFAGGAGVAEAAAPKTRALGIDGTDLCRLMLQARRIETFDREEARRFFEANFRPHRIVTTGFVTGYFEPEVAASRTRTKRFCVPLYRRPDDLVDVSEANRPDGWDPSVRFALSTAHGIAVHPDRAAIEEGALSGRGLELAWLEDPVDAFFIHVQGSARLRLLDGGTMRIAFAGKSGHAYSAIGKLAVERGLLPLSGADKDGLEAWLKTNREAGSALMRENRSFIFFQETALGEDEGPLGAAGVPLTPLVSLAVDRTLHTFHTPIVVDAPGLRLHEEEDHGFRRVMIAEDTGSAIVGAARGDIFFGSGREAGSRAGRVRHAATMTALVPVGDAG
jgi:membrane-bound lytic murein transglycosylase A